MRTTRILLAAFAILALTACGGDDAADTPSAAPEATSEAAAEAPTEAAAEAGGMQLRIAGFQFGEVSATPGGEVAVSNADDAAHTVTADDESFDVQVPAGGEGTFTAPDEAGDYAFVCKIHPAMK